MRTKQIQVTSGDASSFPLSPMIPEPGSPPESDEEQPRNAEDTEEEALSERSSGEEGFRDETYNILRGDEVITISSHEEEIVQTLGPKSQPCCETCKMISDAPTIQCDCCRYWFHSQCERRELGVSSQAEDWYCSKCSQISEKLEKALGNESTDDDSTDQATDEDKIADENEFDVAFECFRDNVLKPALNSPTDENSEVDVNPDWDRCGTCNERYNGAKPMVRCDRCQYYYHCSCQGVPYDEAGERWQCSTCGAVPVNSENRDNGTEWLDNALAVANVFCDLLVSKVGPIKEPALKAILEQCKLKIETILNKEDTGKSLFANHFPLKQQESNSVSWHLLIKISLFILSVGCEECEENGEARSGSKKKKNETAESSESKKIKLMSLVSSAQDSVGTSMEASEANEDLQPEGNYKV